MKAQNLIMVICDVKITLWILYAIIFKVLSPNFGYYPYCNANISNWYQTRIIYSELWSAVNLAKKLICVFSDDSAECVNLCSRSASRLLADTSGESRGGGGQLSVCFIPALNPVGAISSYLEWLSRWKCGEEGIREIRELPDATSCRKSRVWSRQMKGWGGDEA